MSSLPLSSSGSGVGSSNNKRGRKNAPGNKSDPGWDHGIEIDRPTKKVKCKYCNVVRSGGIYRLKHHLAGTNMDVEPCGAVPPEVKQQMRDILIVNAEFKEKKKRRLCDFDGEEEYSEEVTQVRGRKTVDSFINKISKKSSMQTTLNQAYKKEEREAVCQQVCRFVYTSAISFNVVNNPEFYRMLDMVAKYGIGFKPPTYHEVSVKYLNKEVADVGRLLTEFKDEWKRTGCTIMSDGWSDRKRCSICNFLVNSPKGTVFLASIDTSDISKTADKVFKMLDDIVEEVGEENVVQVVTDNASNYKLAGEMLMNKRKRLYWTPCAAHCIDLMLEDLDKKIKIHSTTISKARKITTFIYSRPMLLAWMKDFTKGRELIRPAVTRFATSYLTLMCLNELKAKLLSFFASDKWKSSKYASLVDGKRVQSIVLDTRGFWSGVMTCLKASMPLVKVLRLVDAEDKPIMGFIYHEMEHAKKEIKENFKNVERHYKPILDIIDERWDSQLHRPLHAAAYYLNPQFHYMADFRPNANIKHGLYDCLQRMVEDESERTLIDVQLEDFKNARGLFGRSTAIQTRNKKSPAEWWDSYGDDCPELRDFAKRILSLTCSSSGCERNWSVFEMVHTKKRNRLHQKKLNDLVFVMYNLKLKERQQNKQSERQPIVMDDFGSDDEWTNERDEPELPSDARWINSIDRATRRYARTIAQDDLEDVDSDEELEGEHVNVGLGSPSHEVANEDIYGVTDDLNNFDEGDDEGNELVHIEDDDL